MKTQEIMGLGVQRTKVNFNWIIAATFLSYNIYGKFPRNCPILLFCSFLVICKVNMDINVTNCNKGHDFRNTTIVTLSRAFS